MRELDVIRISNFDFILNNLGYTDVPLEQRAVVFCKLLREFDIPYRRYYTTPNRLAMRSRPTKDTMGMVVIAECTLDYAHYIMYLYSKKMQTISKLNKMLA